jgi:hypothetical protein
MRKASLEDRKRRGLTWDELSYVVPPHIIAKGPPSQFVKLYQVECKWPMKIGYALGSIKGVNPETKEVLVDLGFNDVFWVSEEMGDDLPVPVRIGWRR